MEKEQVKKRDLSEPKKLGCPRVRASLKNSIYEQGGNIENIKKLPTYKKSTKAENKQRFLNWAEHEQSKFEQLGTNTTLLQVEAKGMKEELNRIKNLIHGRNAMGRNSVANIKVTALNTHADVS